MEESSSPSSLESRYLLWVDGVGVFLLCLDSHITFGGIRQDSKQADVSFMTNLSRRHLTLSRSNGGYQFIPHDLVTFQNRQIPAEETTSLKKSATWEMGEDVKIQFRQPTVLSLTAVLDFPGVHRPLVGHPRTSVDRVVLMDQNCLIGAGKGQHIEVADCQHGMILYRSKNQLLCKSKGPIFKNSKPLNPSDSVQSSDIISGGDLRFRLEAVPTIAG